MKTSDRIIAKSLDLFNEIGERNVTTNHIADSLGMSAGNLYYHFRNKEEIIFRIYQRIEAEFLRMLELPDRSLTLNDLFLYVREVYRLMSRYRFFFRDLLYLVDRVEGLDERYRLLTEGILAEGRAIYQAIVEAGVMKANVEQVDLLTRNSWIVVTYWFTFLHVSGQRTTPHLEDIQQGIRHFAALFYPMLSREGKRFVDEFDYAALVGDVEAADTQSRVAIVRSVPPVSGAAREGLRKVETKREIANKRRRIC